MSQRAGLALLALVIGAQYAWNVWTVTPLSGYDGPGHAAYIFTILEEGRLPDPYQGWSTFHPPIYYVLAAGVWQLLEPLGPQAVVAGVRAIGAIALLCVGVIAFVGLLVPFIVIRFTGPLHRHLLVAVLAFGALFVVVSDLVARLVIQPIEIPVGLVTAAIGGPIFLWLLARRRDA